MFDNFMREQDDLHDGWLYVGLSADADLVPDLEKLERELEAAFASLLGSATMGASA
jgi:hypothetical protein